MEHAPRQKGRMSDIFWINGIHQTGGAALSPNDSGIAGGIGVFDSMLSVDGVLQHGDEHIARVLHDADIVIGQRPKEYDLMAAARDVLLRNDLTKGTARIRTVITGGIAKRPLAKPEKLTVMISAAPCPPPAAMPPAVCAVVTDFPRIAGCVLESCKRLDYTRSYAARRQAETRGADEAILTNTNGDIACAATSNLFIVENGTFITPPLRDGVLDGITRRHVIIDKNAREESISPARLRAAEAVYLTNSFVGLRPTQVI
jgi:branched-chain amino acid aminotransferase